MHQLRLIALTLSVGILFAPPLRAVGVSALDLDSLVNDSVLIVAGQTVSVRDVGATRVTVYSQEYPARIFAGVLQVDQVLKGTLSSDSVSFRFYAPETFVGWESVAANTYAVFFFKPSTGGDWEFTNPYYPSTPAVPGSPISGGAPLETLMATLEAVLYSPRASLNEKADALIAVSESKSSVSTMVLRSALSHTDENLRLRAAAALLRRSDSSGLPLIVEALSRNPSDIPQGNLLDLLYGIREMRDPKAVAPLSTLLTSPLHEIREAAAEGLWRTHSQGAIAPLLSMLGDPDRKVRYFSVVGLAEITGQMEWRPNPDDFAAFGTKYVQHWVEWGRGR